MLILILVFGLWTIRETHRKESMQVDNWIASRPQREQARKELVSSALQNWLLMLELPQFEDQKKREEAARQLSIVLFDQLMNGRPMAVSPNEAQIEQ